MQFGILGQDAHELAVNDWIDGNGDTSATPFRLGDHAGKVRVLFAFQAWCPGCHTGGFPVLKEMMAHYESNSDVVFAAIQTVFEGHSQNGRERRLEMLQKYDINLPIGQDDAFPRPEVITAYRTGGTPWFILIDRDGKVIYNDYRLELRKAVKLIDAAIEGTKTPTRPSAKLTEDRANSRFEVTFPNGARGITHYQRRGHVLDLLHTEISHEYRGQGLGDWMMELVLEEIERQGLRVRPVCPFTKKYLNRYQRWHALKV
ncbi:MAG: N-acetyltransferase [Pseudomonadota bacterium]